MSVRQRGADARFVVGTDPAVSEAVDLLSFANSRPTAQQVPQMTARYMICTANDFLRNALPNIVLHLINLGVGKFGDSVNCSMTRLVGHMVRVMASASWQSLWIATRTVFISSRARLGMSIGAILSAHRMSAFTNHILTVHDWRGFKKMIGSNAGREVAGMTGQQRTKVCASRKEKRDASSANVSSIERTDPVLVFIKSRGPRPALSLRSLAGGFINLLPESFNFLRCQWTQFNMRFSHLLNLHFRLWLQSVARVVALPTGSIVLQERGY